jgi:hypothetical protein
VFCVVRNHQVLYVDLIGTCYDVLTKPMPLLQKHIDVFRHKVIVGSHIKQRMDKLGDTLEETANLVASEPRFDNVEEDPTQVVLHKEMFADITGLNRDIRFSQDFLDFAFAESGRISESKQLTVENKFPFSVNFNWELLNILNKTSGSWVKNPFRIRPETATVPAQGSFSFQVEFAPYEPDQYFFQIAQCFVQMNNGGLSKNKRIIAQE